MARIVIRDWKGPLEVPGPGGVLRICRCGLSKDFPFCDSSHAKTLGEEEGKLYRYDENGRRTEVRIEEAGA